MFFICDHNGKAYATAYATYEEAKAFMLRTSLGHHIERREAEI